MLNYDFPISNCSIQTTEIKSGDVIILDGILGLALEEIRKLSDIKIFIKTEDDIRFIRRLTRDLSERGRTVESIINQYLTTVKPMHEYFVEPSIKYNRYYCAILWRKWNRNWYDCNKN